MELALIVAASENNVIGRENRLIWHLSADLKRFKKLTTGYTVVMGRKTFESMGKALPGRRNIVISRNPDFIAPGCEVAGDLKSIWEKVREDEKVFVIGGGHIYQQLWDCADHLYLTRVHTETGGDTRIPAVDPEQWTETSREDFPADEKNEFPYSFINYERKR